MTCEQCPENKSLIGYYICEYCLGHFCEKHISKKNHSCREHMSIYDTYLKNV